MIDYSGYACRVMRAGEFELCEILWELSAELGGAASRDDATSSDDLVRELVRVVERTRDPKVISACLLTLCKIDRVAAAELSDRILPLVMSSTKAWAGLLFILLQAEKGSRSSGSAMDVESNIEHGERILSEKGLVVPW